MTRTRLFTAALLGSAVALSSLTALMPTDAYAQRAGAASREKEKTEEKSAPTGDTVRPEVGKPLQEAQALVGQKKFKEALAKIGEADKVADKTAYENFVLEQLRFIAAYGSGNSAVAEKALGELEQSGRLPQQQQIQYLQALAGGAYNAAAASKKPEDFKRAIALLDRYFKAGGNDPQMRDVMTQAQFLGGDMAAVGKDVRAQIAAAEKAGKKPDERDLQLLANVGLKGNDNATYVEAVEKLAVYYPKKDYWQDLLVRAQKKPGFRGDRLAIDVYRLQSKLDLLNTANDYMEYAQLALQQGAPGEAEAVVNKGYAVGLLGQGGEAERHKRLKDLVARNVAEDRKSIDATAAEAGGKKEGGPLVRLAEAYAGYGQYDKAIKMMEQGLAKGGLKNPEDAKLRLATYYAAAGNKAKAEQSFRAVKGADGTADLARLWLLSMNVKP
ncbi:hypothetical protein [Oleisolibacter albus]|uniref:hypothetical protein n=1 Tax=Oleisolibacter albus TaxID=2171757 RepID=UPI000DF47CEE|nr:hypothetical protein [Oleisolibacter albus]